MTIKIVATHHSRPRPFLLTIPHTDQHGIVIFTFDVVSPLLAELARDGFVDIQVTLIDSDEED